MSRAIYWQESRVEVFWRGQYSGERDGEPLEVAHAVSLLSSFRRDSTALDAIRAVLAEQDVGGPSSRLTDDQVVEQARWRLENGRLVMVRHRLQARGAPVRGSGSSPPPPPPPPPPAARRSQPASLPVQQQCCTNPDCAAAFTAAADSGTPLVERGSSGC